MVRLISTTITDTTGEIEQRKSPLGRMISSVGDYIFSQERDGQKLASDIIKQSAVVNIAARGINVVSAMSPEARNRLADIPVANQIVNVKQPKNATQGVIKANSDTYWYDNEFEKYTPKKYRYQNNGRYAYYENIYKDWFNKYGRMRKPKVNPYSLVKDIQWQQYVRWQRYRYLMRSK